MNQLITRAEYLANTSKLHDDYFLQFATFYTYKAVRERFDISLLLRMYAENGNFDNPGPENGVQRPMIKSWETLSLPGRFDTVRMKEADEVCSLSTMICTLKTVARAEVLQTVRDTAPDIAKAYGRLVEPGEEVSAQEFADRIKKSARFGTQSNANTISDIVIILGGYWFKSGTEVLHSKNSQIVSEI